MLVRSLFLTAALPAVALTQGFEYNTGTSQYRITATSKITQEMMGQQQGGEQSVNQVVTVSLARPAKDTVAGTFVLDSISASNSMGAPMPSFSHLLGVKVQTRVSPNGAVVYSVVGPKEEEVPMASQLTAGMSQFLPKIRGTLAKGSSWADTTSVTAKQYGIDVTRKAVSRYAVVGDTTVAGEAGWTVAKTDSITLEGSGVGQMGAMTAEGSSNARSNFVITKKGAYIGGDGTDDSTVRIVISANGAEIKITTSSTTKVQRVK